MKRFAFPAAVACLWGFALSGIGWANTITETFTVTIGPPAVTLFPDAGEGFGVSSVPQFNPANGTLTSVSLSLAGSGTWTSTSTDPGLSAQGIVDFPYLEQFGNQSFTTPGSVTINVSGSTNGSMFLAGVTGTGSVMLVGIGLVDTSQNPSTDTFETGTGGLSGTLTYTFTPAASPVPEPASLTLASVGGVALLGYGWRRRKRTAE